MQDYLDDLIASEQRLRICTAWLGRWLEGYVNTSLWRGDPDIFFFETDDGEVYAIERDDPSLRVELVTAPREGV
jgi:hypothetical protein